MAIGALASEWCVMLDAVAGVRLLVLLLDVWQLMITVKQESTEYRVFFHLAC